MISRRQWLGRTLGAGAALALTPELLRALRVLEQPGGRLIERVIPSTGDKLPAIGLSFSNHVSCADPSALRAVFKTFVDSGGTFFDAMHGNANSEQFHATVANELGVQGKIFWSGKAMAPGGPGGPPQPGAATVNSAIDAWLARTRESNMDLAMLPVTAHPTWLTALKDEKKAGRVRYIGVQVIGDPVYPQLEAVMRTEPIDFIGVITTSAIAPASRTPSCRSHWSGRSA